MDTNKYALLLGEVLQKKHLWLATAESCTGGWIAQAITSIAGSSDYFDRGFVTYSNQAKQEMLGVNATTLKKYGAVSEQVAREMVEGAIKNSHADISIADTGIAGPTGGSKEKPIGLVWFAIAGKNFPTETFSQFFQGNRQQIREAAVEYALTKLLEKAKSYTLK